MMSTCTKFLNPIDPAKVVTLKRLYSVVDSMSGVLLGAFARDLIFYHIHGIEVPRATKDIDICVQVATWSDFNSACQQLKKLGFENNKTEHPEKFFDTNGQEVDVLPFGNLSEDGRMIVWPQDSSSWTITGIQEAYEHALGVCLEGLDIHVAPPCAMIYLKMFSIHDRPDDRCKKDTGDIQFILENYLNVTGRERLRSGGRDGDVMELVQGDLELAVARIVGRDIGKILSGSSIKDLKEILRIETVSHTRKPIARELASLHKGRFDRARAILTSLRDGFDEIHNH